MPPAVGTTDTVSNQAVAQAIHSSPKTKVLTIPAHLPQTVNDSASFPFIAAQSISDPVPTTNLSNKSILPKNSLNISGAGHTDPWEKTSPSASSHPFNFGVAAQFGKASVGNMQYQIGVVARRNFSEKFYAEATLALAATDVAYSQSNKFQSVSVNAGMSSSIQEKSIDAQYGKNIISLGISPNIGYRLTHGIAVSGGIALYRNLDQSLNLENQETMDAAALSNHVIENSKPISQWDAGLTGSATYEVSRQFSMQLQYRYGLSTYLYFNNEAIRNSGLNVGLKYLFGKR